VDGKLVELPNTDEQQHQANGHGHHEKEEAISLEYNYLLSSQLDSQRIYYEDQLRGIESTIAKINRQIKASTDELVHIKEENRKLDLENKKKLDDSSVFEKQKKTNTDQLEEWKKKCEVTKNLWLEEKKVKKQSLQMIRFGLILIFSHVKKKKRLQMHCWKIVIK
jgi:BRCA1-associated protein